MTNSYEYTFDNLWFQDDSRRVAIIKNNILAFSIHFFALKILQDLKKKSTKIT